MQSTSTDESAPRGFPFSRPPEKMNNGLYSATQVAYALRVRLSNGMKPAGNGVEVTLHEYHHIT